MSNKKDVAVVSMEPLRQLDVVALRAVGFPGPVADRNGQAWELDSFLCNAFPDGTLRK